MERCWDDGWKGKPKEKCLPLSFSSKNPTWITWFKHGLLQS